MVVKEETDKTIFARFDEIETRVDQLIKKIEILEAENNNFRNQIVALEKEAQEKKAAETSYLEEKTKVREKIEALLEKVGRFTETG